ncbi:hypothetical protein [Streptomyces sp. NPDC058291]|uniref:aromatic-ring hydroxylase C-terminal domain-containing protein n=1 Tax=Streptomyces sp. NPDC058291 TaxID=3346427 RepID=UPI0036EA4D5B
MFRDRSSGGAGSRRSAPGRRTATCGPRSIRPRGARRSRRRRTLDDGVFLVRPDGYVGWAGETEAGTAGYRARRGPR